MKKFFYNISDWLILGGLVLAVAGLVFGGWFGASYVEARAYNRITGSHVSAWDAMFVQLRVQEGAQK